MAAMALLLCVENRLVDFDGCGRCRARCDQHPGDGHGGHNDASGKRYEWRSRVMGGVSGESRSSVWSARSASGYVSTSESERCNLHRILATRNTARGASGPHSYFCTRASASVT